MMLGRARTRVVLTASETHADGSVATSRFVDEHGVAWTPIPAGTVRGAGVGAGGDGHVAPHARRPGRARAPDASPRSRAWSRSASIRGGWWFQRGWTDTGAPLHETIRVSYSKLSTLENCELQYVLSAELGLGGLVGYQAWVGKTVHKIIEDCENGTVETHARRSCRPRSTNAGARRSSRRRPSRRRGSASPRTGCCRTGSAGSASIPATGTERGFEFEYDGATMQRLHRPDRAGPARVRHAHHRLQDRRHVQRARRRTRACSSASTTSPRRRREDLKEVGADHGRRARVPEGHYRTGEIEMREWEVGSGEREAEYQQRMRERLSVADRRAAAGWMRRSGTGRTRRPTASSATSRRSARCTRRAHRCSRRTVDRDGSRTYPPEIVAVMGGREPTEEQWTRDLVAARAVRAGRRRGLGQDVGDGRARRVPGARRDRAARRPTRQVCLPGNVLCLTFTNKATENLQQRIRRALAELDLAEGEEPEIMNYHGFAAKLLDRYGMLAGIEPDQRVLSPGATHRAVRARHGPDDVRAREDRDARAGVIDNILAARRPGVEPSAHARGDHRVQRGAAGAVEGASLGPRVPRGAGADRARERRGDLPAAEARPGRDRLRRPDLARAARWSRSTRRWRPSTGNGSAPCCSTSTRTPTSPRPS